MPITIYAILDPRDKAPLYVGCAENLEDRKKAHAEKAKVKSYDPEETLKIDNYLAELQKLGHEAEYEVLEEIQDDAELDEAQKKWIKEYTEKEQPLLNSWVEFRLIMLNKFNKDQIQKYFKERLKA